MFGIIVAILVGLIGYLFSGVMEAAWLTSTHFLFWWYIVFSIIPITIMLLMVTGIIGAATVAGRALDTIKGSKLLGGMLGFAGGAAFSLPMMIWAFAKYAFRIGGTFLLSKSVILQGGVYVWDFKTLIFGSIILLLGLILG